MTENEILHLIRTYVADNQNESTQHDVTPITELHKDRAKSLQVIQEHFDSFQGQDRFWLYALVGLLTESEQERDRIFEARTAQETDVACMALLKTWQRSKKRKMKSTPASCFAIIQFLALMLMLVAWTVPRTWRAMDSDFEGRIERSDATMTALKESYSEGTGSHRGIRWTEPNLLETYRHRSTRSTHTVTGWGISIGALIFLVSTFGAVKVSRREKDTLSMEPGP